MNTITGCWFGDHDISADSVSEYDDYIVSMKQIAVNHNDLDTLRLALEYVLSTPEFDCRVFDGGQYPFSSEEVREIISHAYNLIWPEQQGQFQRPVGVQFVDMEIEDWWRNQEKKPSV